MSIAAMKQALNAILGTLIAANEQGVITDTIWFSKYETLFDYITSEADALKAAIEAAEKQEPVALETVYETIVHWDDDGGGKRSRRELARRIVNLYTTQPAAQRGEELAKLGWQAIECPGCGQTARGFPRPAQSLISTSLAEQQFKRYYRQGYNAGIAAQPAPVQEPVAWHTVHKAVVTTIEKCKVASGMHRAIDLVVNAAQITHDTLGTDTTPPAAIKQDLTPAPAAPVQEPVARVSLRWLAEMILADCGHSSNYTPLLDRVKERIEQWERANSAPTPPAAQPAPVQEPVAWVEQLKDLAATCPELNMHNYDEASVETLNNWAIEVATCIDGIATPLALQRQPLPPTVPSDADINQRIAFKAGWRAAEAAHGIGGKP